MDPYQRLANEIIIVAAKDYRSALRRLYRSPNSPAVQYEVKRLEEFFFSPWFEMLSDANPTYIVERIRKEEEQREKTDKH